MFWDGRNRVTFSPRTCRGARRPAFIEDVRTTAFTDARLCALLVVDLTHQRRPGGLLAYRAGTGEPGYRGRLRSVVPPRRLMVVPDNCAYGRDEAAPEPTLGSGRGYLYHGCTGRAVRRPRLR